MNASAETGSDHSTGAAAQTVGLGEGEQGAGHASQTRPEGDGAAERLRPRPGVNWLQGVAWVLAGAAGFMAWSAQHRVAQVEQELVRRLQTTELQTQQTDKQSQTLSDTLRDTQAKVALLEAKLADSLGQQAQLRVLYDQMARTRGDQLLADAENAVMIAAQQLQFGGQVQSALLALHDADQVLARANLPAMIGVRRVLARDIERLKAVPLADFGLAVARLDALLDEVDAMPLLAAVGSARAPRGAAPAQAAAAGRSAGLGERVARTGALGWEAFMAELRQLVRVQRVDQSEALLLTADQRVWLREMLRLQLMNARLNLLARHQGLFRADVARALRATQQWFDPRDEAVQGAQATLRQLQALPLAMELPSLSESLQALRAARAGTPGTR